MKKVVVLEDNFIDRVNLEKSLYSTDYIIVQTFKVVEEAKRYIEINKPHVVICDIYLSNSENGLEILDFTFRKKIPTVVISNSENEDNYFRLKSYPNTSFLVKPIKKLSLLSTLDNIMKSSLSKSNSSDVEYMFLKNSRNSKVKVNIDEIVYLEADINYSYIFTEYKKYVSRESLKKTIERFGESFIRISNKQAVNIKLIKAVGSGSVTVVDKVFTVGKRYKKDLDALLNP
jgi:DNA-binding LytR/AlgR family response regulator